MSIIPYSPSPVNPHLLTGPGSGRVANVLQTHPKASIRQLEGWARQFPLRERVGALWAVWSWLQEAEPSDEYRALEEFVTAFAGSWEVPPMPTELLKCEAVTALDPVPFLPSILREPAEARERMSRRLRLKPHRLGSRMRIPWLSPVIDLLRLADGSTEPGLEDLKRYESTVGKDRLGLEYQVSCTPAHPVTLKVLLLLLYHLAGKRSGPPLERCQPLVIPIDKVLEALCLPNKPQNRERVRVAFEWLQTVAIRAQSSRWNKDKEDWDFVQAWKLAGDPKTRKNHWVEDRFFHCRPNAETPDAYDVGWGGWIGFYQHHEDLQARAISSALLVADHRTGKRNDDQENGRYFRFLLRLQLYEFMKRKRLTVFVSTLFDETGGQAPGGKKARRQCDQLLRALEAAQEVGIIQGYRLDRPLPSTENSRRGTLKAWCTAAKVELFFKPVSCPDPAQTQQTGIPTRDLLRLLAAKLGGQGKLGKALGVTRKTVNSWVNDRSGMDTEAEKRIWALAVEYGGATDIRYNVTDIRYKSP